jgi:HEPN domain-containing protein
VNEHDIVQQPTTVIDDNIGDYTKPELFFRLASAYADSSHQIVRSMLDDYLPQTFAHAQVTHFLFTHALELFLKGAILKSTGEIKRTKRPHDLRPLYRRYRKLYPKKEFDFTGRIAETIKQNPNSPHSEFPRYPDIEGNVWEGHNAYTLETWLIETEHLREDFDRLIPRIDPLPQPALST